MSGARAGGSDACPVVQWSIGALKRFTLVTSCQPRHWIRARQMRRLGKTTRAMQYRTSSPNTPPLIHKSVLASWVSCAKEGLRVCVLPRMPPHSYMNARRDAHGGRMTPGYRTCHTETAFGCACWCIDALCSQSASPTGRRHDRFWTACPAHQLGKLKCRSLCCSLLSPGK